MNKDEAADFFDAVFASEPAAEFSVWGVPFRIIECEGIGIDKGLLPDVSEVAFEVHKFVIAKNEVHFTAAGFGFGFEFIKKPEAFSDVYPSIEQITDEHEMSVTERPVESIVHNTGTFENHFQTFEITFDIRNDEELRGHSVHGFFDGDMIFQRKGKALTDFIHEAGNGIGSRNTA